MPGRRCGLGSWRARRVVGRTGRCRSRGRGQGRGAIRRHGGRGWATAGDAARMRRPPTPELAAIHYTAPEGSNLWRPRCDFVPVADELLLKRPRNSWTTTLPKVAGTQLRAFYSGSGSILGVDLFWEWIYSVRSSPRRRRTGCEHCEHPMQWMTSGPVFARSG